MRLNGRRKSIGQILIDLTPLLDVVFILLIVVLSFQDTYIAEANKNVKRAEEDMADIEDDMAHTEAIIDNVEEQNDTYANEKDYLSVVTISANYKPNNIKYRTIVLSINGEKPIEIELNPSNGEVAWKECRDAIVSCLEERPDYPMIYKIKNEKMLYRDEQKIEELFSQLSSENSNIYMKNDINLETGTSDE